MILLLSFLGANIFWNFLVWFGVIKNREIENMYSIEGFYDIHRVCGKPVVDGEWVLIEIGGVCQVDDDCENFMFSDGKWYSYADFFNRLTNHPKNTSLFKMVSKNKGRFVDGYVLFWQRMKFRESTKEEIELADKFCIDIRPRYSLLTE